MFNQNYDKIVHSPDAYGGASLNAKFTETLLSFTLEQSSHLCKSLGQN